MAERLSNRPDLGGLLSEDGKFLYVQPGFYPSHSVETEFMGRCLLPSPNAMDAKMYRVLIREEC